MDLGDPGITPSAGCRDGVLDRGPALYRICFPAGWNGDLVIYAHGYVSPFEPLAIPDRFPDGSTVSSALTSLGYGFATTSYRANGLVVPEAVDDIVKLTETVKTLYRPDPRRTYVVGVSEGGLVAALTAERHADTVDGALAACGPIGDLQQQLNYFGDVRVVFDYYFPGVLPGTAVEIPDDLQQRWTSTYVPRVLAALQDDPARSDELSRVTGAPFDPAGGSRAEETIVGALWYNVFATEDAQQRLGGRPFDNAMRTYSGSSDDAALNADVARHRADPQAVAAIQADFQTSGNLTIPVVTLHTTADPVVPFAQEALYAAKVAAAQATPFLIQLDVSRYGHCAFNASELNDAFTALVQRVGAAASADRIP